MPREAVLICEDNLEYAENIAAKFAGSGFATYIASNGLQGADLLGQHTDIGLCILDLVMPPGEEGGLFLLRRIRTYAQNLPIVIFTGEGTIRRAFEVARSGASEIVEKHAGLDVLLNRALELLAKHPPPSASMLPISELRKDVDLSWRVNRAIVDVERQLRSIIARAFTPRDLVALLTGQAFDKNLLSKLASLQAFDINTDKMNLGDWFTIGSKLALLQKLALPPSRQMNQWAEIIVHVRNDLSHLRTPTDQQLVKALLSCHDLLEATRNE